MELFELPAAEYKAALYLLQRADAQLQVNAGKTDLAEALQVSPAYATKLLAALIDKGLIERVRRGRYMVKPQETETGERLLEWPSRLLQWSSGLQEAAKTSIQVMTNTTTATNSESLIPSNEGIKALRAGKSPEGKNKVPIYSSNDDELAVIGETREDAERRRTRRTSRRRKPHRRASDFGTKPRSDWTTYDAANYFSASIDQRNLRLWASVNVAEFEIVLNTWLKNSPEATLDEVLTVMDKYLDDAEALNRLERDPRPARHFLRYLKQTPRALPRDADFEAELIRKSEEFKRLVRKERAAQ